MLADTDKELRIYLINSLSTNENSKHAASLIKEYKYDIEEFPDVKERLMKSSMRYYLGRFLFKKPNQEEFISLHKIEDLFDGFRGMLAYLVEDLTYKSKYNEAKGLYMRHNLQHIVRPDVRDELEKINYDPSKEEKFVDDFGPVSKPAANFMQLPLGFKVEMVSTPEDIKLLDYLKDEPYIGVDSEWRPSLTKFHYTYPALF